MKILLVATVQSHICQFHRPLVKMLHDHGCEVHVAAKDNLAEKNGLKLDFVEQVYNVPFERSPFDKSNIVAYSMVKKIIDNCEYDVVHTNTPVGGIIGRLAAIEARRNGCKVFYTAHGFHFFKGGDLKNWVLYYPVEKFMSRFCDELITITNEDHQLAERRFNTSVSHIHGIGANTEKYHIVSDDERISLRSELGYSPKSKIILCTGELNSNKNQITAVRAVSRVLKAVPDALLLLAGNGQSFNVLQNEIRKLELEDHVKMLGYRTDLERFVNIADLIVSCSKREGLPVNIIEGMLCKKAVVASINRGHKELVTESVTGYLVDATDDEKMSEKMIYLLQHKDIADRFGCAGYEKAQLYTDRAVYNELEQIYRRHDIV